MRNILKQTSWLFLAQSLSRIIGFFYTIFLAGNLGVEDFGQFSVALAYFSIFSSIADFGFNRFLVKEVAKDKSKASHLLWNVTILRLTLTSVLFAVFSMILYLVDPDKMRISLILLATLAILPQSIALTLDAIFVGMQKLQFSALSLFAASLSTALIGLYMVTNGFGSMGAVVALIFGQLIYTVSLFSFLKRNQISFFTETKLSTLKKAVVGSLPYGLLGILGLVYFRIDTIMLSYMRGSFETGLYGVSYKFLEAVIFIPGVFASALFPILAKLHDENLEEMKNMYFKSIKLMVVAGLLIFFGYILVLPEIIRIYLPQYLGAIDVIKILALSIPFIFAATPGVQVLLSSDKYLKTVILLSIFTVVFNIVLNLIFIPKFGLLAASWITVASDLLSFVLFYLLINRKIFDKSK